MWNAIWSKHVFLVSLFYNCFGDILLGVIKDQSCSSSTVGFVLVVVWRPFTVWVHSSSYPGCFNMVVRSRYWLITVFDKVSRYFPPWRMFCSHVSCFSTIQSVAIHATVWTMNILHVNVAIQVSKSNWRYMTALVCGSKAGAAHYHKWWMMMICSVAAIIMILAPIANIVQRQSSTLYFPGFQIFGSHEYKKWKTILL